jgi:hypothetical protein
LQSTQRISVPARQHGSAERKEAYVTLHRSRFGSGRRAVSAAGGCLLVIALLVGVTALPAAAVVYSNSGAITIPAGAPNVTLGPASPYPSSVAVSGLSGTVVDVNASITGFNHARPSNVDILLVGPYGQAAILLADAGGGTDAVGASLVFDDAAPTTVPTPIVSGMYKPTNLGSFNGPSPAPAGPYGNALSIFNGTSPNGTWDLYVYDDTGGSVGSITGGWSLDITTNGPTITSFSPTSGGPGTSVVISGANFTGATFVTFGGVFASFTVDFPSQITAVVPDGAVSGPIAVTTTAGIGVSSTTFTVVAGPVITSFVPAKGRAGTSVVITGSAFIGTTAVAFNGVSAAGFTVDSGTQITATVPAGATTGPISVTVPSGTGTSATSFVVRHPRKVSLTLGSLKAKGTVSVADGFTACASGVPVMLQRYDGGEWRTIAEVTTKASGAYAAGGVSESGMYRVVAKATTLDSGDRCMKRTSPTSTK